jgi:N-acetylneuraminate synthase
MVKVIAEIGINHNGDLNIAKKLIDGAVLAGADIVKFQKRTVELVYSKEQLETPRVSPFGTTTREQKYGIEFTEEDYDVIYDYCKQKGIEFTWSSWDLESQKLLQKYDVKYNKVASAMLTNLELLHLIAKEKKYTFISTGMSELKEIHRAVQLFNYYDCPIELMHCNSTYPMKLEDANLKVIEFLRERYNFIDINVGWSDHSNGRITPLAAVALGATSIEVHITLDRNMYGSDQSSSLEIPELIMLVKDIRNVEKALGTGEKTLSDAEMKIRQKLRGV